MSDSATRSRYRHVFKWTLAAIVLAGLMALAASFWLVTSTAGAQFSLSMLERVAGVQIRGISGSLHSQLHIQHIALRNEKVELSLDDVNLQWQPGLLWRRQIRLDQVRVGNMELALVAGDASPAALPVSLKLPDSIRLISVNKLTVQQFQLATLEANHQHSHPQQFSAFDGAISINSSAYTLQFAGITPWGKAALNGSLGTAAPFNVNGRIDWQGLAIRQGDVTLPETRLSGSLAGNLSRLQLQAQLEQTEAQPLRSGSAGANGKIRVVLTPFASVPLDTLQLDVVSLNPANFYKDAPKALLTVKADFKGGSGPVNPVLSGHFSASNAIPASWNSGGIPAAQISSDLVASEQKISWKATRIELQQGGLAVGEGEYIMAQKTADGTSRQTVLPDLNAKFELKNVNLLRIDSRLRQTRLTGSVQAINKKNTLNFTLNLQESDPNLPAQLRAEVNLDRELRLGLRQLELKSKEATLTVQGSLDLQKNQEFKLIGEAHNFNPARWIAVPDGQIATKFNLVGQLQKSWRVDAQLSALTGQFAGMELHGESDFKAEQNRLLTIRKMEVSWGKNHASASGSWQLGQQKNPEQHEQLQFNAAIPDLASFCKPFKNILTVVLQGSLYVDGALSGNAAQPSGRLVIKADQVAIPDLIYLDHLQADLALADGAQGKLAGKLDLSGLRKSVPDKTAPDDGRFSVLQLHADLAGQRHAHTLQLTAMLPQKQQITLRAQGDLQETSLDTGRVARWSGQVSALDLSGPLDFQLMAPFALQVSDGAAQMGNASWRGKLGRLQIQQLSWSHGQLKSAGQFQEIPVARVVKLWRADAPLTGDLTLDAAWQFDIGPQVSGQIQIQRSAGDLVVQDMANGHSQPLALGLKKLTVTTNLVESGQFLHQKAEIQIQALGAQLGAIDANLSTFLNKTEQGWELPPGAPLSGQATLQVKNIRWMSPLLGPGVSLGGELDARAQLNGTLDKPDYRAKVTGSDLQIVLTELGVSFPNGRLDASIESGQLTLNSLKFSQSIKKPPVHDGLNDLQWLHETGYIESSGSVDLHTGRGAISTRWQKFPFLQNPNGWLVASGQAQLAETDKIWNLTGKLVADGAYFSVPKQAAPKLSNDVVVLKKTDKRNGEKSGGLQTSLDFSISTGSNFIFVGRGLDTRLDGDIRIRSKNGGSILATGSIQTMGGTYEGYGQKLAIDRGILNFQGPIDNPGLNVRAVRHGLAVEAGVEVVGTVARPEVHLISEPNVPDADKLSWMVLGRASDQMAGSETALLMSAAGAIFSGDSGSTVPANIARSLGLGDISFGTTGTSPESQMPVQTVAGAINSTTPNDQVFSVGKRLTPNIVLSIERSLTDASNGLKLTWQLTRRFSIIGRAGSDTALDGQYTFSFD